MLVYQQRMMEVLNKGDDQDATSRACDIFLSALILLNLAAVCLESVESINREYNSALVAFEWFSVSIFLTEYLLRIWSIAADNRNPAKTPLGRRARYIFSFTGLIDLAAILPSILPLIMGGVDLRWLRVLRLVRLLKTVSNQHGIIGRLATLLETIGFTSPPKSVQSGPLSDCVLIVFGV